MGARFQIKIARWETARPIIPFDRTRPAFRGQYATLRAACFAMDTRIRLERGMPERADVTRAEIQAAMTKRAEPSHHVGQHLQGCRACYAYVDGRVSGSDR